MRYNEISRLKNVTLYSTIHLILPQIRSSWKYFLNAALRERTEAALGNANPSMTFKKSIRQMLRLCRDLSCIMWAYLLNLFINLIFRKCSVL